MLDGDGKAQDRELAPGSHVLEDEVRNVILRLLLAEAEQVVGAREIRDLAEAFAWVRNPAQAHGGSAV